MEDKDQQVSINLRPEVASGTYSNLAIITHSPSEFVLDFAANLPGVPSPMVQTRVIMAPEHAKRLLAALSDNIARYESVFGKIHLSDTPRGTINLSDIAPMGGGSKS